MHRLAQIVAGSSEEMGFSCIGHFSCSFLRCQFRCGRIHLLLHFISIATQGGAHLIKSKLQIFKFTFGGRGNLHAEVAQCNTTCCRY